MKRDLFKATAVIGAFLFTTLLDPVACASSTASRQTAAGCMACHQGSTVPPDAPLKKNNDKVRQQHQTRPVTSGQ